jgi:hypothetical protein
MKMERFEKFIDIKLPLSLSDCDCARNTNRRGRLSTVDLLIKVACFVT